MPQVSVSYGRRKKKQPMATKLKKNITAVVKQIEKAEMEKKYLDTVVSGANLPSSGDIQELSNVPQGIGQAERIGDSIQMQKLYISAVYTGNGVAGGTFAYRFLVFRVLGSQTAAVVTAAILTAAQVGGPTACCAMYELSQLQAISILYDSGAKVPTNSSNGNATLDFVLDLKGAKVRYNPTAVTGTGRLYCLNISDNSVTVPEFSAVYRLQYTDA